MKTQQLSIAVLAAALCAAPAMAQEPGSPGASNKPMVQGSTQTPSAGIGGSGAFSGWLSDYQAQHQGRVSRQAYMDEVGRRWDAADRSNQGLTVDQINQAYGFGGAGTTNASPGNMGPKNVKK